MGKYKFGIILAVILGLRLLSEIFNIFKAYGTSGSMATTSIIVAILYLAALIGAISHQKSGMVIALILALLDLIGSVANFSSLGNVGLFNFGLDLVILILVYLAYWEIKRAIPSSVPDPSQSH